MLTSTVQGTVNGTSSAQQVSNIHEKIDTWLCHHEHAAHFCKDILFIAARWDDLIDHDQLLLDADIHQLMEVTLSLPCNPFYIQHFLALSTLIHNSVRNWKTANIFEREHEDSELASMNAFILRASYIDIIGHCAMLINGNAWAEQVVCEARLFFSGEGFHQYLISLKREKEVRRGDVRHG